MRTSDTKRLTASLFRVPDDRVEISPVEIGEWDNSDFREGDATIEIDISSFVPTKGGNYNLGLDIVDGRNCRVSLISLGRKDINTGEKNIISSDGVSKSLSPTGWSTYFDHRLEIPRRADDETLFVEIKLTGGGTSSAGYITLRNVWSREQFPQERIDMIL